MYFHVPVRAYYRHVEKWLTKGVDELLLLLSFWQMTLTRNGESHGLSSSSFSCCLGSRLGPDPRVNIYTSLCMYKAGFVCGELKFGRLQA